MALFWTGDCIALACADVKASKEWWRTVFGCTEAKPRDDDAPLPSNVALKLPGHEVRAILLSDRAELEQAGFSATEHPILFTRKLSKALDYLRERGAIAGPIEESGGTEFFEIRDLDGNVIEVCTEP